MDAGQPGLIGFLLVLVGFAGEKNHPAAWGTLISPWCCLPVSRYSVCNGQMAGVLSQRLAGSSGSEMWL